MTHDTRWKTGIERKGVPMAKGRDDQKGSTPRRGRASIDNGIPIQMFPTTPEGIQPSLNEVRDSRRIWMDERSQRSPPKYKNEIEQIVNIGYSKVRKGYDVMSTTKKRDYKFCAAGRKRRNPNTCLLCEPTAIRNGDMLHPNRKDEGNHMPATEQERKYKKEIMEVTAPFHRFQITHLPKILNSKAEVFTGLATIKLEFINQEVSVGIKTRPSVEETSSSKKGKAVSKEPGANLNYNWETSRSN
ncbi:hypothetical protein Tco_0163046 [Tanacetum coccineum]